MVNEHEGVVLGEEVADSLTQRARWVTDEGLCKPEEGHLSNRRPPLWTVRIQTSQPVRRSQKN